jgi:hypothetical protein
MMAKTDFRSVDEHIASQPEAVQGVLERLRTTMLRTRSKKAQSVSRSPSPSR